MTDGAPHWQTPHSGTLAAITSVQLKNELTAMLTAAGASSSAGVWIGGRKAAEDSGFRWRVVSGDVSLCYPEF